MKKIIATTIAAGLVAAGSVIAAPAAEARDHWNPKATLDTSGVFRTSPGNEYAYTCPLRVNGKIVAYARATMKPVKKGRANGVAYTATLDKTHKVWVRTSKIQGAFLTITPIHGDHMIGYQRVRKGWKRNNQVDSITRIPAHLDQITSYYKVSNITGKKTYGYIGCTVVPRLVK